MLNGLLDWAELNAGWLWWLGAGSLLAFLASLLLIPVVIARMPADFFHPRRDHRPSLTRLPGSLRAPALLLKNLLGVVFVLAGILMLVLPGQGVLTILIGLSLTDFPGKRELERRLIGQPAVLKAVNWLRVKAGQPVLDLGR